MSTRHPAITNWTEIEKPAPFSYDGSDEPMAFNANFPATLLASERSGSTTNACRLVSGCRGHMPRAPRKSSSMSSRAPPDVWLDGMLHRLKPGDAAGFPAGDGPRPHLHQQHGQRGPAADRRRSVQAREQDLLSTQSRVQKQCAPTGGTTPPNGHSVPTMDWPDALRESRGNVVPPTAD